MANVFPNSNLASSSQPWGREVQKRVEILESQLSLQKTNSATVDAQLQSSYRRLDATVGEVEQAAADATAAAAQANTAAADAAAAAAQANTAINGLVGLGSTGSSYTINADNINAGSISGNRITGGLITGTQLQSATSGQRVVIESNRIALYGQSNIFAGQVYGQDDGSNPFFFLSGGGASISMSGGAINLASTTIFGGGISGAITTTNGNIRGLGVTSTQFLQAENHAGGGTTGASINNNGTITRTSSSERYKQDIEDLSINYEDLLSLQPKRFRLKDEAADDSEARYYAGFIAEEIDQTSLKDFVAYRTLEDGSVVPDGVYYGELTSALLEAIKHQDTIIKSLTERIAALENDKV
jgi:hypothetical protein